MLLWCFSSLLFTWSQMIWAFRKDYYDLSRRCRYIDSKVESHEENQYRKELSLLVFHILHLWLTTSRFVKIGYVVQIWSQYWGSCCKSKKFGFLLVVFVSMLCFLAIVIGFHSKRRIFRSIYVLLVRSGNFTVKNATTYSCKWKSLVLLFRQLICNKPSINNRICPRSYLFVHKVQQVAGRSTVFENGETIQWWALAENLVSKGKRCKIGNFLERKKECKVVFDKKLQVEICNEAFVKKEICLRNSTTTKLEILEDRHYTRTVVS